ncbi:GTP-binding protein TypA, partial [gut metagenome]
LAAVVGVDNTDIGDVYTDPENPVELDPIEIDPPTLSIVFEASTSPLVGRDGDIVGARQLKERLFNERENNVTMRIEELDDKTGVEVSGRGILHLSVLMETMRREGYEFQVAAARAVQEGRERQRDRARGAGRRGVPGRVRRQGHRGLRQRRRHHDQHGDG